MTPITITSSAIAPKKIVSPLLLGYLSMGLVLLIWSGFALTMRAIHSSPLATADVALIRFVVPLVLLAPFIPSRWQQIRNARISDVLLISLGGLPFFLLAAYGAASLPSAYVGNFLVGTQPFFVPVLLYLVYRQTLSKGQGAALSVILLGIIVMTFGSDAPLSPTMVNGFLFLIAASLVWAFYTISLKRATLDPICVAIISSAISLAITLGLIATGSLESHLELISLQNSLVFILVQGLGVGVLATIGYAFAIRQIGPARAAIMGSLSPVLTAILALLIFHEALSTAIITGISLTTLGVLLSTAIKTKKQKETRHAS